MINQSRTNLRKHRKKNHKETGNSLLSTAMHGLTKGIFYWVGIQLAQQANDYYHLFSNIMS